MPSEDGSVSIALAFDDNRLASDLFGQFDQNLALIEQRLGIDAIARGNQVSLRGPAEACEHARRSLQSLYRRLKRGDQLHPGDVEGAIAMAQATAGQLSLPTLGPDQGPSLGQIATRKRVVVARTPTQDAYIRAMRSVDLTFGIGPAGTGKTFLAVAYAAELLERGEASRLILSRPAVEAGERLGFLPGDMKEKVDPYLRPLYDALYDMMAPERVERGMQSGMIEVAPLAFMRGRTLTNAVCILDEAQNTTPVQMKMFLTRLGEGSKMIVTGDPSQVDLPPGQPSGLANALSVLDAVTGIAQVRFSKRDVVRHPLVSRIIEAYEAEPRSETAPPRSRPRGANGPREAPGNAGAGSAGPRDG